MDSTKQQQSVPFHMPAQTAFYIFLASHLLSALYSPIQDCDEVFNYWEPTHYLTHGHAFQTWEYSPDFAIRSWTYAGLHAIITKSASILSLVFSSSKVLEFYLLRSTLAFVCAICEARLFSKLAVVLNPRVAIFYLIITLTSPGMYHASTAYLPSSFAMYFTLLGIAAFMDWRGGLRTAQGIFCFGTGACIGWPFAAALSIPFLAEELLLAYLSNLQGLFDLGWRVADGVLRVLCILALQIAIDSFFYKKLVIVPWNIIHYNIFSGNGPDLYGTEPWHFYLRNLFLNFHLWLPLALASLPLLLLNNHYRRTTSPLKSSYLRGIIFTLPFYLWLTIMTLQPHKEERFLYPAYPALILNASISLHIILSTLGTLSSIPIPIRLFGILTFMTLATFLAIFRILGTWTAFSAPLSIYTPLHSLPSSADSTICLGKEWYRFPSHFLLPQGMTAKFIPSEFRGLLPGEFSQAPANSGFGMFPGTWLVPSGMNGRNEEDVGKYVDLRECDFLVDSSMPSAGVSEREPDYVESKDWEVVKCLPFLDAAESGLLGRLGWIPERFQESIPRGVGRRVWGRYCLLKRRGTEGLKGEGGVEGVGLRPGIETLL